MKLKKFLIGGIFRNLYSNPPISSDSYILQAYQLDFTRRNNLPADYFTVSNELRGLYNKQWRQKALDLERYKLEEKHLKDEKMMRENAIVPINFGKEPTEAFQEGGKFYEDLPDSERWDLLYNASMSMPKGWGDPEGWLDKYLKAKGIQRRLEPTLEDIMSALEGMKTPKKKLVQKVPKNQEGVKFGGSNKSNRFLPLPVNQIPELTVNGQDKRWRFSTRLQDFGNGHGIKSQHFYDAYDGGNHYLGDLSVDKGGRTIYYSPKGNDTIYWNTPTEWIWYKEGLMPIGKNEVGAKANFFKNLKRPLIKEQEGGHIERADNTRVQHIPNNGEGVYEMTPQGIGDFLPLVGTWRAAQRIDKGEPNANYGDLAMNAAMDLLGARMIGPVFKAASKFRNIEKGLKSRGFVKGSERAHMKNGSGTNFHKRNVEVVNDYAGKPHYFEHWGEIKTVPNVDYYNVAMQPMIQSLRVPATAPFKGVTVVGSDLSKNYRFPYGGINVVSKPINGGLDSKLNVYLNPFDGHEYENLTTKKDIIQ